MIFFDTETIGLHGLPVLIQWAEDEGDVVLHNVWLSPVDETIELIEKIVSTDICGFNLAFDWFQICKTYNIWRLLPPDSIPIHSVESIKALEKSATSGPCLKPKSAVDLMMIARKGVYQSTMNRKDIYIRKVPTQIARELVGILDTALPMKDVYFARKSDPSKRWQVMDVTDDFNEIDPDFKDVVLKFAPSSALKALAVDALGVKVMKFDEVDPPSFNKVEEVGWAPFNTGTKGWSFWVWSDAFFWDKNQKARKYAEDDVILTRQLFHYFEDPEPDVDSELACMVAAVRWRGFSLDIPALSALLESAKEAIAKLKFNYNSPAVCKKYLQQVMTDMEAGILKSTGKVILEDIAKWTQDEVCECQGLNDDCICHGSGLKACGEQHPAAIRAQEVLDARAAGKEIELYEKLLTAGRFHASFKVIGALSSRMSGADGLNAQGIKKAEHVRRCFTLADQGLRLSGGDFDAFEISIMDAAYHDPRMHAELVKANESPDDNTLKIHTIWGQKYFFPHLTRQEIVDSKKKASTPWEDLYGRSKSGVFAVCYFGEAHTLVTRVGLPEEVAEEAYNNILKDYPVFAEKRKDVIQMFCSMSQPGGIGTRVVWSEPAEYIESLLGFKRYFTLENQIVKVLFDLGESPPASWNQVKGKVVRRDRMQTSAGAARSAVLGAAFSIQGANMRAAGNHRIQSTGADITKRLQHTIWSHQPCGIANFRVMPMNVHDEVMVAIEPSFCQAVRESVEAFVESYRGIIPLIGMQWKDGLESWASK